MKLLKVYRYVETYPPYPPFGGDDGGGPEYRRELYDAVVIPDEGGCSSPIGPNEEFEIFVDEIE